MRSLLDSYDKLSKDMKKSSERSIRMTVGKEDTKVTATEIKKSVEKTVKAVKETAKETAAAAAEKAPAVAEAAGKAKSTVKKATAKTKAAARKAAASAKSEVKKLEEAQVEKTVVLQYQGHEVSEKDLLEKAEAVYKETEGKAVKKIALYLKPEEYAAYYVINGSFTGKLDF